METVITSEMIDAVKDIDLSNPATIKTAAVALIVLAVIEGGKLTAKLLLKGLKLVAGKTKNKLDDAIVDQAEKELKKR